MSDNLQDFDERLDRIKSSRGSQGAGMGFIVHPDGVVSAIGPQSNRLRFGFPLKGLVGAMLIAVMVKAYIEWFLGIDVYTLEVERLLSGTAFEKVAGVILMPDALTTWVAARYQEIFVFVSTGLEAASST